MRLDKVHTLRASGPPMFKNECEFVVLIVLEIEFVVLVVMILNDNGGNLVTVVRELLK